MYSGDLQSKSLAQTAIPGVFHRQTKLDVAVLAIDLDHIPVLGPRLAQTTLIIDCMVLLSELSSHAVGIAPLQAAVTIGRYWKR